EKRPVCSRCAAIFLFYGCTSLRPKRDDVRNAPSALARSGSSAPIEVRLSAVAARGGSALHRDRTGMALSDRGATCLRLEPSRPSQTHQEIRAAGTRSTGHRPAAALQQGHHEIDHFAGAGAANLFRPNCRGRRRSDGRITAAQRCAPRCRGTHSHDGAFRATGLPQRLQARQDYARFHAGRTGPQQASRPSRCAEALGRASEARRSPSDGARPRSGRSGKCDPRIRPSQPDRSGIDRGAAKLPAAQSARECFRQSGCRSAVYGYNRSPWSNGRGRRSVSLPARRASFDSDRRLRTVEDGGAISFRIVQLPFSWEGSRIYGDPQAPQRQERRMARKFENILETVGNTPVVRINRLAPPDVNLYVKIEAFNPLGSVKDRLALGVIEAAERSGELKPGQTVIEATSGNTGIGLAMVCAQKGYPLVVTMAETFSVERRKLMRFLGAKVVLTPAAQRGMGMVVKAFELAKTHGWFLTRQFENEANPDMHSRTTAREIITDFAGERLDYWVTGYGTGGTLKGVARVLAKERPDTKIIVCEPQDAPLLESGIAQQRNPDGSAATAHPAFKPHPLQGWTPDFIPKLTADAVEMNVINRIIPIPNADALRRSRDLAQKEGIFVGITAGATFAGALRVCTEAPKGATVLCMLPDTGERYLSTPLFADIPVDMNEEEIAISRSTP